MRLAEFKTRLFIFFAGRLLKWAKSIEQEITNGQSPPATLVDDSNTVLLGETSHESEAVSGPPEHWARLVASGTPQHWLDLIREKAPQLLPLSERQLPSTQACLEHFEQEGFEADEHQEAFGPPARDDGAADRSKPRPPFPGRKRRRETKYPPANANRSTWLNRLRFQPPVSHAENADATYTSNNGTVNSDSFLAAGGAAEEGSESTLLQSNLSTGNRGDRSPEPGSNKTIPARQTTARLAGRLSPNPAPDKTIDPRQTVTRLAGSPGREEPETITDTHHQLGTEYAEFRRANSQTVPPKSSSDLALRKSRPDQTTPETVKEKLHANRLRTLLERSFNDATGTGPRSSKESIGIHHVETSRGERAASLKESDRVRDLNFEQHEEAKAPAGFFHQVTVDEPAVEPGRVQSRIQKEKIRTRPVDRSKGAATIANGSTAPVSATGANARIRNEWSPSGKQVVNVVRSAERTRREFASVEPAEIGATGSRIDDNEKVWPILPPPPKFDVADELAVKEQEAEALRRLDQEQRGNLWNG